MISCINERRYFHNNVDLIERMCKTLFNMACRKNGLTFDMETIYKTAIYDWFEHRQSI